MAVMVLSAGLLQPVDLEIRCLVNHLWSSFLGKLKSAESVSRRLGLVSISGGTQLPQGINTLFWFVGTAYV